MMIITGRVDKSKKLQAKVGLRYSLVVSLLTILLSVIASAFWVSSAISTWSNLEESAYSQNQFLGSRLSLFNDLRPHLGTKMGSSGYAYFLSHSIETIGEKPLTQPFVLESELPRWMLDLDGTERVHNIVPRTNDLLTFGVQSTVTFSLTPLESFPERLIGQWVTLVGDFDIKIPALVIDGSPTLIAVRGNIPPWFFANEIVLPASSGPLDQAVDFVMASSLAAASVRGGLVPDSHNQTLHLWRPPWKRLQNAFPPKPGDQLEFSDRSRVSIAGVQELDGRYFVTLEDPSFRPYFSSRSDVVTLRRRTQGFSLPIKLHVNTVTNSDFLNGRERYYGVALSDREGLEPGTIMALPRAESAYVVFKIEGDVVTFDLAQSLALQLCLAATREADKAVKLAKEEIMSSWSRKKCFEDSPQMTFLNEQISSWSMLEKYQKYIIMDVFQSTEHLTWTELWSRSLFMDMVSKANSTEDEATASAPRIRNENERIWEIYPGSMLNIYYGELNPAPINLMIHVLGSEERENYYGKFEEEKPEFFVFAKPHAHTPWIVNWHWPVFENVLLNYEETFSNVDFSLWRRRDDEWRSGPEEGVVVEAPALPLTVPDLFSNPADACTLRVARVSVDYEIDNPWGFLPLIGRSDRMLITAEDTGIGLPPRTPASLPPESGRFSFPIVYRAGAQPYLAYDQFSPFGRLAELKILRIQFTPIEADQAAVRGLFLENYPFKAIADVACPPAEGSDALASPRNP